MSLIKLLKFYLWQHAGNFPKPVLLWWQRKNIKILLEKASQLYTYRTLWLAQKNWGDLPIIDKTLLRQGCLVKDRSPNSRFVRYICDRKGRPFCLQEDFNFSKHKIFLLERLKKNPNDFYSIPEFGPVAEKCSRGREGFHVYDQSMILEIADDMGARNNDDAIGRVVITYFLNHYMPFVRYDTGERGLYLKKRCVCGKKTFVPEWQKPFSINISGKIFNRFHFDNLFRFYYLFISRYEILEYDGNVLKIAIEPGIFWQDSRLFDLKREAAKLIGQQSDQIEVSLIRSDKSM